MDETICLGDYITLRNSSYSAQDQYLFSSSELGNSVVITDDVEMRFDDCLWQVSVQNQYSAQREYRERLLQKYGLQRSDDTLVESSLQHQLQIMQAKSSRLDAKSNDVLNQLRRAAVIERKLNEKLMKIKSGKSIAFGDPIQLKHVKSG
jgi:hypothetical protein